MSEERKRFEAVPESEFVSSLLVPLSSPSDMLTAFIPVIRRELNHKTFQESRRVDRREQNSQLRARSLPPPSSPLRSRRRAQPFPSLRAPPLSHLSAVASRRAYHFVYRLAPSPTLPTLPPTATNPVHPSQNAFPRPRLRYRWNTVENEHQGSVRRYSAS